MTVEQLPTLNACLNAAAAALMTAAYVFIRLGMPRAHMRAMLCAVAISSLFLASYLFYHWQVGATAFPGTGALRLAYFSVLISHTVLAASVPVLVAAALWKGLKGRAADHRRIARWALPIWLYVSVSGVAVYLMLYRIAPQV